MELTHDKLPELFKNIRYSELMSESSRKVYILNQSHTDVLEIHWFEDDKSWGFVKDNFPCQRKFYSTNFPIKTKERFISEMKLIGINLKINNLEM